MIDKSDNIEFITPINSKYYDLDYFNNLNHNRISSLNIIHTNLASISKHFDDLSLTLSLLNADFHIIAITEHKNHKDTPPTKNIDITGYYPFHYQPTNTTHGGAGFYIKKSLDFDKRDDLSFNSTGDFESCFIEITIPNKKNVIVGCIYRHPSSPLTVHQFNTDFIEPMLKKVSTENKLCILTGDFNIDLLKIENDGDANDFYNIMTSYFFAPFILQPTRPISKSLIDNIFINSLEYKSISGNLTIMLSDHLFQFVILEGFFKDTPLNKTNTYERNFKNFNEREFHETILGVDWDDILSLEDHDPNISIKNFYNYINFLLDDFAPYRKLDKKEMKLKTKPWINKNIQDIMKKRDKLLHKFCKEIDPVKKEILHSDFKNIRNKVTKLKRESKILYYNNFFQNNKNKSSIIWKGIRSLVNIKNSTNKTISIIDDNGRKLDTPLSISSLFNTYFVNVGPNIDKKIPITNKVYSDYLTNIHNDKTFFLNPCNLNEIYEIILTFDLKKSVGPNSIPMYILKVFNEFFSANLSKIFNLCFETGVFPDLCKLAKVIPIFKKGDHLVCKNYRPISLLPIFSKILEKLIYNRMYSFLNENNLIYNLQFGFRSNYSTNHALISIIEYIKKSLDNGNLVGGIFIDLEKAFDTVNYEILCNKLPYYGFRGKIEFLIKSFLSNRKQCVSINGFVSTELPLICGVPQGSTLGPLLFLIYINDFRFSLQDSLSNHFADDTCILYSSKEINNLESVINDDLIRASLWLKANKLSLNADKSKLLIFHSKQRNIDFDNLVIKLDDFILKPSDYVKYLGIFIDKNLSWDFQIQQLSVKLSRANGIISKLRHFVPKSTLISVYYSIFYSHLIYGCPVWSLTSDKNLNTIRVLQKKCLRIMNFADYNSHTNHLFINNKLLKVDDIIHFSHLQLIFDYINRNLPDDLYKLFDFSENVHDHCIRSVKKKGIFIPSIKTTNFGNKSLRYATPVLWNNFIKFNPNILTFIHKSQLKNYLKKYYFSNYLNTENY